MKKRLSKLFLTLMLLLNISAYASSCGTTIDDIDITSLSSNLINFDFTATLTPDCIGFEFDLYVNNVLENTLIINSPYASSGSISSSINLLDNCIKLVGRSKCSGGGSGDDFSIIVTVDDLWDCYDFNDICDHSNKKFVSFSFQDNIKVRFDLACFCASIDPSLLTNPESLKSLFFNKVYECKNHKTQNQQQNNFYTAYENCIKYKTIYSAVDKKGLNNVINNNAFSFKIYPNPSLGKVFIEEHLISSLEIYNLIGKKIPYTISKNEIIIDDKTKGLLIFKSSYNGKSAIEKILVK